MALLAGRGGKGPAGKRGVENLRTFSLNPFNLISLEGFNVLESGKRIRDYILDRKIGQGGMGEVWLARHFILEKKVAIKILTEALAEDPNFGARFIDEAKAMALLQHPNIVGINEFFTEEGVFYLVMPFLDGGPLTRRLHDAGGFLPLPEVVNISCDILEALNHAHEKGIIHRDVKPSNILLNKEGRAFLTDFGIALMRGVERKTRTGVSLGTPHYISPEQLVKPRTVDNRADIYSYGCVLYEMLAGRPPFDLTDSEADVDFMVKQGHLFHPPPPLRQFNPMVLPSVEEVVVRSLEKEPERRFPTCATFAEALKNAAKAGSALNTAPTQILVSPLAGTVRVPGVTPRPVQPAGIPTPPPVPRATPSPASLPVHARPTAPMPPPAGAQPRGPATAPPGVPASPPTTAPRPPGPSGPHGMAPPPTPPPRPHPGPAPSPPSAAFGSPQAYAPAPSRTGGMGAVTPSAPRPVPQAPAPMPPDPRLTGYGRPPAKQASSRNTPLMVTVTGLGLLLIAGIIALAVFMSQRREPPAAGDTPSGPGPVQPLTPGALPPVEPGRYMDPVNGFSIVFPPGWRVDRGNINPLVTVTNAAERKAVTVRMEPLGQDMPAMEYLQHAEPYLLGEFTNVSVVNKGAMTIAAQEAAWIEFNFQSGSGAAGTGIGYILIRERRAFGLLCIAPAETFEGARPLFMDCVSTFRFERR